ncbi:MAG: hypothetical protein AAGU76_18485 [Sedimentibacter sp.]|uniref:hypothetical protein n=1 Tax=Sedimentibacter sp. TaxID=1960295 RepID=UPI00315839F0
MNQIKDMLLGITFVLIAITLFFIGVWAAAILFGIIGIGLVLYGYFTDNKDKRKDLQRKI